MRQAGLQVRRKPWGAARRAAAPFLVASLLLAPGAAAAADRPPVVSLLEMRHQGVVVQQWDLSCSAAALATILTYQHGDPVSERTVLEGLIGRPEYLENPEIVRIRQGFSLLDLKRYVETRGYQGLGYGQLDLADLVELAPVLVPVRVNGYNHFVVVRGVRGGRVFIADPAFGNRTDDVDSFVDSWIAFDGLGRTGFVVRRPGAAPAANRMAPSTSHLPLAPDALLRTALPFSRAP